MKTAQELADRLAELAGWKWDDFYAPTDYECHGRWVVIDKYGCYGSPQAEHPYPPNSLDALEAFRREQLAGFHWDAIDWSKLGVQAGGFVEDRLVITDRHPDEWTARASALIAAKETP